MPQINNPVLHRHKLAFFCMPKCANSSVKQSIRVTLRPDIFKLDRKSEIRNLIKKHGEPFDYEDQYQIDKYKDYLKIGIIRNPFERTISTWAHKINNRPQWPNLGFWPNMAFEEYVKHISTIPDSKADIHFKSQTSLIAIENRIVPENIFLFEDFPGCWKEIQKMVFAWCGLKLPDMPHYNQSKKTRPDLNKMPELKNLIIERYKKDFELLGYSKNI